MNYRESYTYKFVMISGLIFWVFIIAHVILKLDIEIGAPEPTLGYAILFIIGLSQMLLWIIGNCIIIPLSYLMFFILLIVDVRRTNFNKSPRKLIPNKSHYVHTILATLGFILGGISSILTILDFIN